MEEAVKEVMEVLNRRCKTKFEKLSVISMVNRMYSMNLRTSQTKGTRLE